MVLVFSMDKPRTAGQKKLVIHGYHREPFFLLPENVCQRSIHSDSSVESYRGHRRQRRQLTDRHQPVFSDSGGLKTWRFHRISESHSICHSFGGLWKLFVTRVDTVAVWRRQGIRIALKMYGEKRKNSIFL